MPATNPMSECPQPGCSNQHILQQNPRFGVFSTLCLLLGVLCVIGSINEVSSVAKVVKPEFLRGYFSSITALVALFVFAYATPRVFRVAVISATTFYLAAYGVFPLVVLTSLFALLIFTGSWFASEWIDHKLQLTPELSDTSGKIITTILVFILATFSCAFILLAVNQLTPNRLMFLALTWAGFWSWVRYAKPDSFGTVSKSASVASLSASQLNLFLSNVVILILLVSALIYFHPGAPCGDSDKGYLALAKFYARGNTLFLQEPAVVKDGMRSFPHLQEIYFTVGYVLSGTFGAKFLAWLLIVFKLVALYVVSRKTLGFSSHIAKLVVISYSLSPIVAELNAIERPENLLALVAISLIYFAELFYERCITQNKSQIGLLLPVVILCSIAMSVKYTAFFLIVAVLLSYWRAVLYSVRNSLTFLKRYWLPFSISIMLSGFWYLRNLYQWGEIVSLKPFGRYHLTIYFPPLRSLSDIWQFLTDGFLHTKQYTEFSNFGYGLWGTVITGGCITGLAVRGQNRRIAFTVILFFALMLNSSRQIRYLGAAVPLVFLVLFALPRTVAPLFDSINRRIPLLSSLRIAALWRETWVVCFVIVQAALLMIVSENEIVGSGLRERLRFTDRDFTRVEPYFSQINDRVKYPEVIATSGFDANFNIDSILQRVDPIWSLAELSEMSQQVNPAYYLLPSPGEVIHTPPFFNDVEFFESIADPEVYAGYLYLFKANPKRLDRVVSYAEAQGWNLANTVVVSEGLKKLYPFELILGEELKIPKLKTKLFRLDAMWWENNEIKQFGKTEEFSRGSVLGKYFEDIDSSKAGNRTLSVQIANQKLKTEDFFGNKVFSSVIPGVKPEVGVRSYQLALPIETREANVVVEIYARGQAPNGSMRLAGLGSLQSIPLFTNFKKWVPIAELQADLSERESLDLSFEFLSPEAKLKDIRVVLRRPHQLVPKIEIDKSLLKIGVPLEQDKDLFYISEDFGSSLKHSKSLNYKTERDSVTVSEVQGLDHSMVLQQGVIEGSKKYRIKFAKASDKSVVGKVFLRGRADSPASISLKVSGFDSNRSSELPASRGKKLPKQVEPLTLVEHKLLNLETDQPLSLVGEFKMESDKSQRESQYELEVEVVLRSAEKSSPAVSDLVIILGTPSIE